MDKYLKINLKTKDAQEFLVSKGIPKNKQPVTEDALTTLYDIIKRRSNQNEWINKRIRRTNQIIY